MFFTKSSIIIWLIYICCGNRSFISTLSISQPKLSLHRSYCENTYGKCEENFATVLADSPNEDNVVADAAPTIMNNDGDPDSTKHEEIVVLCSANGSIQRKTLKINSVIKLLPPQIRVDSLSKDNDKRMDKSYPNISEIPSCNSLMSKLQNPEEKRNFFVITAIFNPASYKSRYNLYHKFAQHMNETGAQLITIECIFPSLNQHEFQVTDSNNPFHIQLKSESIYWMKENLINIAVSRLPPHAKWVCWLDADIEFEETNWLELTLMELKKYTVVQIFEKAKFLGPPPKNEVLRVDYSFGYSVIHNRPISRTTFEAWYPHPGYGWAMSVNDFRKMNGLPDYNIVGSGDRFFAYSLMDRIYDSFTRNEQELPFQLKHLISDVGNTTFKILQEISKINSKKMVGYVPVTIRHYWHGSIKHRQYCERWKIFKDHNFDFKTDVRRNEHGLFEMTENKPKLQTDLLLFFNKRQEDQIVTDFQNDSHKCKARKLNFYEWGRRKKQSIRQNTKPRIIRVLRNIKRDNTKEYAYYYAKT